MHIIIIKLFIETNTLFMKLNERERHSTQAQTYRYVFLLSVITLALAVASSTNIVRGDNINPGVYSTLSAPYGIPYQQWLAEYWRYDYSLSKAQHPRDNYTPEKCANGQHGTVWFLTESLSGTQERTCTIPAGKSILAAVLTGECNRSDPTLHNDQDVRKCATEGNDYGVISATLDGVPIKNLDQYRTDSGYFNLTIPEDNIFNEPKGIYRAFANGVVLFLEPLRPGTHDLHLTVSVQNPIKSQYSYAADWTYHLIVKP
jgi:hypothetical protein